MRRAVGYNSERTFSVKILIDDSGSFSWHKPGVSLFAGILLPDRVMPEMLERFGQWRRTIIGKSNRELKGAELTSKQMYAFAYKVLSHAARDPLLTVVGADTRRNPENLISRCRDQVAQQFAYCEKFALQQNPKNKRLAQHYKEGAGWVRKRSPQNFLWVNTLEEQILQCVQHLAAYFIEPEDDAEFESIEIIIDRSFVRRDQQIQFWKEWLRNGLVGRSHRSEAFAILEDWRMRDHPFIRKYERDGVMEFSDLYQKHMRFDDSQTVLGLQVADICAHICYRFHRRDPAVIAAYNYLRPRIVGGGGRSLTLIQFTEQSLFKDSVENHVKLLDVERMRSKAAERRRMRVQAEGESSL